MVEKHQYSACKFCGLHPQIAFWCDGSAYVRCQQWNMGNCINHGPEKATEREAVEAWNKLQEPNAELTGAAPHGQQPKPQEIEK